MGKCLIFGLKPGQVDFAGTILKELARDWRELLVGDEGYLVGPGRAGLERHRVVWGEMVGRSLNMRNLVSKRICFMVPGICFGASVMQLIR